MHRRLFTIEMILAATLWISSPTAGFTQVAETISTQYPIAISTVIQQQWEPDSYSALLEPGSSCAVRIIQLRGGDILNIDILPECEFPRISQAAVIAAVRRASPLPYNGFQSVYQREIRVVVHAASASDRQAWADLQAKNAQVKKDSEESDRRWQAKVGMPTRRTEYTKQCSFHLLLEMPRVKLRQPTAVIVTVDKSGKVVGATGANAAQIDEQLMAALRATSPCERVPADLIAGQDTINIGPMTVQSFSD